MSSGAIELSELYGRSYLLRFLYGGVGRLLTVSGACLLWTAMQVGLFLVLCWRRRTLSPDDLPGGISLLEDTTALGWHLLLPWCYLLLYYSSRLSQRYLNGLPELLEPACPPEAHEELLVLARHSSDVTGRMIARCLFTACGLLLFAYNAVTNYFPDYFYGHSLKWDTIRHPENYVFARLGVLFVWGYAVPVWASEVYAQMAALVRVNRRMAERDWLRISPYASDGFGGLRRLMVASSWASCLVLVAGLFFLAPMLRFAIWGRPLHVGNYVGLGLYVLCAAVSAAGPVLLLHRVLARKKAEMLDFFTEAFDSLNVRVTKLLERDDVKGLADENFGRALETVDRLRVQWCALPVWPLSVGFFVKALAAVAPPVAAFLWQHFGLKPPL